jgi:hypothetical protein
VVERPTSLELVGILADFLHTLQEEASGEARYQLLVAAHACDLVARDLQLRMGHASQDLALLRDVVGERAELHGESVEDEVEELTRELARRIRTGDFDDRLEWLGLQLAPLTRRKLEIARPGYDEAKP